jgi:hypothetical protein
MRLKRRDLVILLVAWLVVALGIVTIVILFWPSGGLTTPSLSAAVPTVAPTYTVEYTQVTARGLYPQAEAAARAWQADVQLASVATSWPQTAVNLLGNPNTWTFRFYSPSQNRLYLVSVTPDGQVTGTPHFRTQTYPPVAIDFEAWSIDAPDALAAWLDNGGGSFLGQRPGIEVMAQLSTNETGGGPVWTVVGLGETSDEYWVVLVDAITGQARRPEAITP